MKPQRPGSTPRTQTGNEPLAAQKAADLKRRQAHAQLAAKVKKVAARTFGARQSRGS